MPDKPRPEGIVLASAVISVLPSVLLAPALVVVLLESPPQSGLGAQIHDAAIVVLSGCAVLVAMLILAEWRAMRGRSLSATKWIFRIFAYLTVLSSLGLIQAALCVIGAVTGLLPKVDAWHAFAEFGIHLALYSWCGIIAFGHLRWWHVLNQCNMPNSPSPRPGMVGDHA